MIEMGGQNVKGKGKDKAPRQEAEEALSEEQEVQRWRRSCFRELLPSLPNDEIEVLVHSQASPHDVKPLLAKGCSEEVAAKILA